MSPAGVPDAGGPARRSRPVLLAHDEVDARLDVAKLAWRRQGDELVKTLEHPSFREAVAYVGRVAEVAESADHHPDIDIRWRTVTLRLTTHSAGGLTALDLEVAAAIDALSSRG